MADKAFEEGDLPPPGTRWGTGARSVLPYLTKSLQAKPAASHDTRELQGRETPAVRKGELPPRAA